MQKCFLIRDSIDGLIFYLQLAIPSRQKFVQEGLTFVFKRVIIVQY